MKIVLPRVPHRLKRHTEERREQVQDMTLRGKIGKGLLASGAGLAALAAFNANVIRVRKRRQGEIAAEAATPVEPFSGERRTYARAGGDIFYRVAGSKAAPALVFIHDVNPGASHFMWRRNFDDLAADFRVYALDLPGFGASAKPPLAPYSAQFYVEAISGFLRDVVRTPAHLVASALGASFAVLTADNNLRLVRDLVLIAPPIIDLARHGMTGAAFYSLLHSPVLGTSFYNAVASERSIRDHARKQFFYDKRFATDELVARLYRLSHVDGAQYATTALLSGYLNTDARQAFARLRRNVTVAWGAEDRLGVTTAHALSLLNPRAELVVFPRARLWLQEERAGEFNRLLRERLRSERIGRAAGA